MMKDIYRMKTWAGPLTIGSFVIVAVTGILMLFHIDCGLAKHPHEVASILLVFGAIAHVIVNWRAFFNYFRKPVGATIIGVLLLFGVAASIPHGEGRGHGRMPGMEIVGALENSSLELVAQVAKCEPQAVAEHLKSHGIQVRDGGQTISEIASGNGKQTFEILSIIAEKPERAIDTSPKKDES